MEKNKQVLLNVRDLVVGHGMRPLNRMLNLRVLEGENITLFAPNGRGKTTLLETLVGMQGSLLGFVEITSDHFYLSTKRPFYPHLTLLENLKAYGTFYQKDSIGLSLILEYWGLNALQGHIFSNLSDGEKRRAHYALGQYIDPQLWLVDEPYVSLDQAWHGIVDNFLIGILDQGKGLVVTQHQPLSFGRNVALEGV